MAIEAVGKPGNTGDKQDEELTPEEMELCLSVLELWQQNEELQAKAKKLASKSKANGMALKEAKLKAKQKRAQLAQSLSETKAKLCGKGRGGKFATFLKRQNINKMMAWRLVKEHESSVSQKNDASAATGHVELNPAALEKLVKSLQSKCLSLKTRDSVDFVLTKLTAALQIQVLVEPSEVISVADDVAPTLSPNSPVAGKIPKFDWDDDYK
jgi:hypothetical protein